MLKYRKWLQAPVCDVVYHFVCRVLCAHQLCVTHLCALLGPLQTQRVHPPAVTDGVEEPTATGCAGVAAGHM